MQLIFFFLVSSMVFGYVGDNICLAFLSFFFQISYICLVLNFIFNYWDEVIEEKIGIIIITIVYFLYRLICPLISYHKYAEYGYEVGVVITDYIILFPIAFFIYCLIGLMLGIMSLCGA